MLKLYKKSLFCRFGLRKYGENTFEYLQKGAFWGFLASLRVNERGKGWRGGEVERWRGAAPVQPEYLNA